MGMRIGINGKEASIGQAYQHLDTTLSSAQYQPGVGQKLSALGTIIALEKGSESDEFFLTFEVFGNNTHIVLEPAATAARHTARPASRPPMSGCVLLTRSMPAWPPLPG